jgi:hypothetical protein
MILSIWYNFCVAHLQTVGTRSGLNTVGSSFLVKLVDRAAHDKEQLFGRKGRLIHGSRSAFRFD